MRKQKTQGTAGVVQAEPGLQPMSPHTMALRRWSCIRCSVRFGQPLARRGLRPSLTRGEGQQRRAKSLGVVQVQRGVPRHLHRWRQRGAHARAGVQQLLAGHNANQLRRRQQRKQEAGEMCTGGQAGLPGGGPGGVTLEAPLKPNQRCASRPTSGAEQAAMAPAGAQALPWLLVALHSHRTAHCGPCPEPACVSSHLRSSGRRRRSDCAAPPGRSPQTPGCCKG